MISAGHQSRHRLPGMACPECRATDQQNGNLVSRGFPGRKITAGSRDFPLGQSAEEQVAERTGLEPATSGVTGRRSNRLNYRSIKDWATCSRRKEARSYPDIARAQMIFSIPHTGSAKESDLPEVMDAPWQHESDPVPQTGQSGRVSPPLKSQLFLRGGRTGRRPPRA
jgi:hypothetical protein